MPWHSVARRGRRPHLPARPRRRRCSRRLPRRRRRHDASTCPASTSATSTAPITTRVEHGVGDVEVIVPRDADVAAERRRGRRRRSTSSARARPTAASSPASARGSWVDDDEPEFVLTIDSGTRRRGGVPWLTTASSRPRRPAWQETAGPGLGDRHPARRPRTPQPPRRRVDLGRPGPGRALRRPGDRADDRAWTCRSALWRDGGLFWVLLIGAGVALLLSELRKARRRR